MSENNKKYGEAWRAELMKWRKSEIIDFLKDTLVCNRIHQWHYPSKGELPQLSKRVLVKAKYQEDVYVGEVFSPDAFTVALKRWVLYADDGDYYYSDKEIIAWQYLPEPPKEM